MTEEQSARVWRNLGSGDPPLLWALKYWPSVAGETRFLNSQQYWHSADQLKEAAREQDPCKCPTLDIVKFRDMWELRDKGGCLGKINLRIYFHIDSANRTIVVLGVLKKEDENQLRQSVVVRLERRLRLYLESTGSNRR